MRFVCRALVCATLIAARPGHRRHPGLRTSQPATISGAPTWAKPESDRFGFAPLTVTQSGVTYSPAAGGRGGRRPWRR